MFVSGRSFVGNGQETGCKYVEIKCQLDATEVFIADLIACSTCFGHQYAYHQELKSIIQWLLPVVFRAAVLKLLVWCGAQLSIIFIFSSSTLNPSAMNATNVFHPHKLLYVFYIVQIIKRDYFPTNCL
jgi:hypothetical protein